SLVVAGRRCSQELEVVSRCFQRRVELKGLPIVRYGLSFVAYRLVGPAKIAMRNGWAWVDLDGLGQVGDSEIELGLFIMGGTPAGVSGVIVRLELNGLSEVLDSAIEGSCLKMRRPSSQIRRDIIGIGLNCLGMHRDWTVNLLIEFVYHWL